MTYVCHQIDINGVKVVKTCHVVLYYDTVTIMLLHYIRLKNTFLVYSTVFAATNLP